MRQNLFGFLALFLLAVPTYAGDTPLKIATFEADVTPPIGTPLCDGLVPPAKQIVDPLLARGIILLASEKPIVMVAVDWVGIGNSGHHAFRDAIAKAVGTSKERVCVHCLHQHDAPGCDFEADELLVPFKLNGKLFDPAFARKAIERVANAAKKALASPKIVTHIGLGKAKAEMVASARRVLGPDGKVKYTRTSATRSPEARAEPEGVIDPFVHTLAYFNDDVPLAIVTYYATHPQSHYGRGGVTCDFPGLARNRRERDLPGPTHIHFNGAGGNVTAGKYNDGDPANRPILADRLAKGMKASFEAIKKEKIDASKVAWRVLPVALPVSKLYNTRDLKVKIADEKVKELDRLRSARAFVWARRCEAGEKIDLQCLKIGTGYVLHMPGELFVEYQLAAQKMRSDASVMMAAYGDYGMGYIGQAISYTQGGYETGPVSRVAPESETVLMNAMRELLK